MTDNLLEVISAAIDGASVKPSTAEHGTPRRVPMLRAVQGSLAGPQPPGPAASGPRPLMEPSFLLGRGGLRLAFWLCGFHETLRARQRRGEALDQRETSLLALSSKDFAAIRPAVIGLAIEHLQGVLAQAERRRIAPNAEASGGMESFALESLCALAARATDLLRDGGPDSALALFGGDASMQEPLAIFQQVFSACVSLAESFARLIPNQSPALAALIETLESEVERI